MHGHIDTFNCIESQDFNQLSATLKLISASLPSFYLSLSTKGDPLIHSLLFILFTWVGWIVNPESVSLNDWLILIVFFHSISCYFEPLWFKPTNSNHNYCMGCLIKSDAIKLELCNQLVVDIPSKHGCGCRSNKQLTARQWSFCWLLEQQKQ